MSDNTPQKNRLARFLLSYSEADLGISAVILLLVSTIGMTIAFIIFAAEQTRPLQLEFIHVGFHNPKFFEDICGIAGSDLFRFVLNPNILPTNNAAERGLQEIVVHRKIRGGIRTKETMTWLANFFSCVMTWKNNKLDYLAEIAKYA